MLFFQASEELKRMAHSKARVTDGKVTYPPGVKEISDKISKEEMVRRLKVSVSSFFLPFCTLMEMNRVRTDWETPVYSQLLSFATVPLLLLDGCKDLHGHGSRFWGREGAVPEPSAPPGLWFLSETPRQGCASAGSLLSGWYFQDIRPWGTIHLPR